MGVAFTKGPMLLNAAYTYSDFRFDRYVSGTSVFDGNRIPGLPVHRAQGSVTFSGRSMFAVAEVEAAAVVVLGGAPEPRESDLAVVRDLAGPGVPVHVAAADGTLVGSRTS